MGAQTAAGVATLDADLYDSTRGGEIRGRRQARGLAPLLDRDELVVDIGAGTGVVALGLREQGFDVVALDLAEQLLRRARARLGGRAILADAARLPLPDGAVYQCLSVWVLHAVADPGAVLAEVARVLRPGGRLLVLPADGPLDDEADWVTRLLNELQAEVEARRGRVALAGSAAALNGLAATAGLRLASTHRLEVGTCELPPAAAARDLEQRAYRWLADLDEAVWAELVAPAIAQLRGPGADRPILRRTRPETVYVLERPKR